MKIHQLGHYPRLLSLWNSVPHGTGSPLPFWIAFCRGLPSKWVVFFAFLRKLICLLLTKACTDGISRSTYIRLLGVWVLTPSKSDDIYCVWTSVIPLIIHVSQLYYMAVKRGLSHTTFFTTNDASQFFAKSELIFLIWNWLVTAWLITCFFMVEFDIGDPK